MSVDGRTVIPATVLESLETIQADYRDVECNLKRVLTALDPDVLVQLPPLDRAHTFFILAKAVATLFSLRLRCSGESPGEHPVTSELDRLDLYESKMEHYIDKSKAPLHPTTAIDAPAATRFIEHSLPDLTPEQRRDMQSISRGERHRNKSRENRHSKKKRKQEAAEKQSVAVAAAAFLAEASKKLFDGGKLPEQKEEEESEGEM